MTGKLVAVLPIAAGLLAGCQRDLTSPMPAAEFVPAFEAVANGVETNVVYPVAIGVFIACANGGSGEVVVLTGNLHELFNVTLDGQGGAHVKSHFQPQQLAGVGLITGDRYQGTGVTQDMFNAKVGETYTFVNNYRIIGQGPDNNFVVHEVTHVTVRPDGTVSAMVDQTSADCQ